MSCFNSDTMCISYCIGALGFFYSCFLSFLSTLLSPGLCFCPFSFFEEALNFHLSICFCLTLQILLQVPKVSFVDVATLSIRKHRSSCYIYKDDSLSQHLPRTHSVSSLQSLFCLTPVPVQLSPCRKQRHSSEMSLNGTRAVMA